MYAEKVGQSSRATHLFVGVTSTANVTIASTASSYPNLWRSALAPNDGDWARSSSLTNLVVDPLIAGTRIPIYRVAALLDGGMTAKQVAEDFPSLTVEQILAAQQYAKRNPPSPGVSYPKESLKRLLRDSGFVLSD